MFVPQKKKICETKLGTISIVSPMVKSCLFCCIPFIFFSFHFFFSLLVGNIYRERVLDDSLEDYSARAAIAYIQDCAKSCKILYY